jgi:hypothetical protein
MADLVNIIERLLELHPSSRQSSRMIQHRIEGFADPEAELTKEQRKKEIDYLQVVLDARDAIRGET